MSDQITKTSTSAQHLKHQSSAQRAHDTQTQEHSSSASASVSRDPFPQLVPDEPPPALHGTVIHIHASFLKTDVTLAQQKAGLNLNLFAALSGAFSSESRKETHRNADGSSDTNEQRREKGAANAVASGQGNAYVAADAQERGARTAQRGVEQGTRQVDGVSGKKQVDHLGLEG